MKQLSGWGRCPVVRGVERRSEDLGQTSRDARLTRGLGRSYGDASLPDEPEAVVASSLLADRLLAFEPDSGLLRAEAGFTLAELDRRFWPRGWASPVAPGTEQVTLGGMVASDVHGKNHHVAGCFGEHVRALRMRVADGRFLEVTEATEPELFRATLGGMGLTGHILEVEVQLERIDSPWIWQQSERLDDLAAVLRTLRAASQGWPFSVAWVDALVPGRAFGRGIVSRGRWARKKEAPTRLPRRLPTPSLPFTLPGFALSRPVMRLGHAAVFQRHRPRLRRGIGRPAPFFFPLDTLRNWNRLYGPGGFVQYACVIPEDAGDEAVHGLFATLRASGGHSYFTVIKDCGAEGRGLLSYPRPGISLALDLPMRGAHTQEVVDALNEFLIEAGGRIYLTKDALTRPEHFRAMEPRLDAFLSVRRKWDPDGRLKSALSVRLLGDEP